MLNSVYLFARLIEFFPLLVYAASRPVFELGAREHVAREHVTPSLLLLHWLPVRWRIQYKLCCLMHSVSHGNSPMYLKNTVQSASASRPQLRQCLRSTSSNDFMLPQQRSKFGKRAFSHAGPSAWNSLSDSIRTEPNSAVFRKHLKTHFFCSAFNVC